MSVKRFVWTSASSKRGSRPARSAAALGFALVLLAAACGSDDEKTTDSVATTESVATTSGGANTTAGPSDTSGGTQATTGSTEPVTTTAPVPEGKPGGSLTYAHISVSPTFDPVLGSALTVTTNGNFFYPVFGSLVTVDNETRSVVTPNFAKSLKSDDGGLTWTLVLNDGIRFSDGEPYDAAAVKFNWDRYKEKAAQQRLAATLLASAEVVDPLTLSIKLTEPLPNWDAILGPLTFIGSPKAITEKGDAFSTSPVGAGPFLLKEFLSGESATFVRNPNYWKKGLPYLDEFKIVAPDPARRTDALLSGDVDIAISQPNEIKRLEDAGLVAFQSPNKAVQAGAGFLFNTAKPPFDDKELRCALVESIDMNAMNRDLAAGKSLQTHDDGSAYDSFVHVDPIYSKAHKVPPYNHEAAQAVFDAYAKRTGGPLRFDMVALDVYPIELPYLVTQWATYKNLEINPIVKTVADATAILNEGGHSMALYGWPGDFTAGLSLNQIGHSLPDGSANPWHGYTSPEWDAALDEAKRATDVDARNDATRRAQDVPIDECFFAPMILASVSAPYGHDWIKNWSLTTDSINWETIWVDR